MHDHHHFWESFDMSGRGQRGGQRAGGHGGGGPGGHGGGQRGRPFDPRMFPGAAFGFLNMFRRGGARARRGDIRSGILALLAEQPRNGYQIMQELEQRSRGMWRPSPGAVYPALQQLEDEGLIDRRVIGRRARLQSHRARPLARNGARRGERRALGNAQRRGRRRRPRDVPPAQAGRGRRPAGGGRRIDHADRRSATHPRRSATGALPTARGGRGRGRRAQRRKAPPLTATQERSPVLLDISPLRRHRDFRLLFIGQFVSFFGSMITYVAVPYRAVSADRIQPGGRPARHRPARAAASVGASGRRLLPTRWIAAGC